MYSSHSRSRPRGGAWARARRGAPALFVDHQHAAQGDRPSLPGAVWPGRDRRRLMTAARYAALNPARARLVKRAEDCHWSSGAARLAERDDDLVSVAPLLDRCADLVETGPSADEKPIFQKPLSEKQNSCYRRTRRKMNPRLAGRPPTRRKEREDFFYFFRRNPLPIRTNKTKQIQAILFGFIWSGLD
jgi:hypothetical protein